MDEKNLESAGDEPLRSAVQRRLEFLDFRLWWSGRVNRKDLSDVFRISPQQASADIGAYEKRAPQNLRYDNALKTYLRTDEFEPAFVGGSTDRYLLQLVAVQSGWMRREDTWFETIPPLDVVSLKRRSIDPQNLQRVLEAIRGKLEIEIEYSSINSATNSKRWIAPHALGYSAARWHVRAWSRERNDFRDFNLNRIGPISGERAATVDTHLDYEWDNFIDLILVPNSNLDIQTQHALETEFNMTDGRLTLPIRLALVFYVRNEYNLDVAPGLLDPKKQQLTLENQDEVESARRIARKMSGDALKRAEIT
ncbi:MAG TPA: WYL domain-containing protein [Bryobacteraceae bacterium]|jgi:hypothetical protein